MSRRVTSLVRLLLLALAACVVASACGKQPASRSQYMPVRFRNVPPRGLCRVNSPALVRGHSRDCDDIEWAAAPGQAILFRPDDESRHVVVCYMSHFERGRIEHVDVFDYDTRRLVKVMQRDGEPPVRSCQNALWAFLWW
jgi:hypothetical protein